MTSSETAIQALLTEVSRCRICRDRPQGRPLPHEPRPVLQMSATSRILIAGQAPGTRVHASGRPFTDPSGDRLRRWLGLDSATFYDASLIAILPMGFCFPGLSPKGADLPPRRECAPHWRPRLLPHLGNLRLIVTLGLPAARWHVPGAAGNLADVIADWRKHTRLSPPVITLPHPSWRNNALLKKAPYIEQDIIPMLQELVRQALQ